MPHSIHHPSKLTPRSPLGVPRISFRAAERFFRIPSPSPVRLPVGDSRMVSACVSGPQHPDSRFGDSAPLRDQLATLYIAETHLDPTTLRRGPIGAFEIRLACRCIEAAVNWPI